MRYTGVMGTEDNMAILLLPGMDGSGSLLMALVESLASRRPVHVISYPSSASLTYDDLSAPQTVGSWFLAIVFRTNRH
jgi:hypothetical protein